MSSYLFWEPLLFFAFVILLVSSVVYSLGVTCWGNVRSKVSIVLSATITAGWIIETLGCWWMAVKSEHIIRFYLNFGFLSFAIGFIFLLIFKKMTGRILGFKT